MRRPIRTLALPAIAAGLAAALTAPLAATAAGEALTADVALADQTVTGPLQNSTKRTYLGVSESRWYDTRPTAGTVTYPVPGALGVVSINGTCVPIGQSPSAGALTSIRVGDGSQCLTFRSEVTAEGFFTFRVEHEGAPSNGHYLGDGNRGGVQDLIATTPDVLYAIPEAPAGSTVLSVRAKDDDGDGAITAKDTAVWSTTILNTGNVRLRSLNLELSNKVTLACAADFVEAGATMDCASEPIALEQTDIDRGSLDGTLKASATTPRGVGFSFAESFASLAIEAKPAGVTSTTTDGEVSAAGESIRVTASVANHGNVTLDSVAATVNGSAIDLSGRVAPNGTVEHTFDHEVTQEEFDAGRVVFATAATGLAPSGSTVVLTPSEATIEFDRRGEVSANLTPVVEGEPEVGDLIALRLSIKNEGNASVRNLTAGFDKQGLAAECAVPSLAPGASIECDVAGAYTVTQADVDAGSVPFHATINAVDTAGARVSAEASASQDTVAQAPAVAVTVMPELRADGKAPVAGDLIGLSVRVENSGNVTLHGVAGSIDDRSELGVVCPEGALAPGAAVECTVPEYVLTQDDIDRGEVVFDATVVAVGPKDQRVAGTDSASVTVDRQHGIVATASANLADDGTAPKAGDRVELSVTARNVGNTTLRGFAAAVAGRDLDIECADGAAAPGAETACSITDHVLTQAEIDAGAVDFDVTVTATGPGGARAEASDAVSVELARVPAIELSATSVLTANQHEVPLAGDTATVEMTIRNTGNVTVTGVRGQVADRDGLEADCPSDELAPGEEVTCEVSEYTLTQSDVDAGGVRFDVTAAATGSNQERVEAAAETTLTIVRAPAIETTATATLDTTENEHPIAGDTATVRLTIQNTGNVTVRNLAGSIEGRDGMVVTCDTRSLAPGKSADCTLSKYELTQGDVDAGKVDFAVTSTAIGANGQSVAAQAKAGVGIEQAPAVDAAIIAHLAATETEQDAPRAGDRVAVSVRATNTGNVTLTSARSEIVELANLPVQCAAAGIAPGKSIDCTVPEYVLTQGDIEHGQVTVAAVLDADAPAGNTVNDRDEVKVGLNAKSVLDITAEPVVKDSDGEAVVLDADHALRPGDEVWVRYSIANTGNLVVNAVQHLDDKPSMEIEQAILQPGERTTAMTTDAHTVTDAEAAEGTVVILGQVKGQVTRADGDTVAPGAATTGQTGAEAATENTITARVNDADTVESVAMPSKPVWVFSTEVRTTIKAEPAPIELAFTGSEITQIVLPAGILLLLSGLVLLVWIKRRRKDDEQGRHRA